MAIPKSSALLGKRGVIYARFSSHGQNDQSIETQIDVVSSFFAQQGIKLVGVYHDRARSGRFKTEQRYELMRLVNDSYDGKFDIVGVYDYKRWFRNEREDIKYEQTLNDNGVELVSATEALPEHRLAAKLLRAIGRVTNQEESDVLSERVTRGLETNVKNGKMTGGSVTWGYILNDEIKYEIDENIAPYVRFIFESYSNGLTMNKIRESLAAKGVVNSSGVPFAHNQHISKILHNDRYIGIFTYKEKKHYNYIPPIVDETLFYKVQKMLETNKGPSERARNRGDYILSGKAYCGHCNSLMHGISGTGKSGKLYYYYKCSNAKCHKRNENRDAIENLVTIMTVKHMLESDLLNTIADTLVDIYNSREIKEANVLINLEKQQKALENEIKNLVDAIKKGLLSSAITDELNSSEYRLRETKREIEIVKNKRPLPMDRDHVLFWFNRFLVDDPTTNQQRLILDIFVHKVIISDEDLTISYNVSDKSNTSTIEEIQRTVRLAKQNGDSKLRKVFVSVTDGGTDGS